jgi:hypothetical protein
MMGLVLIPALSSVYHHSTHTHICKHTYHSALSCHATVNQIAYLTTDRVRPPLLHTLHTLPTMINIVHYSSFLASNETRCAAVYALPSAYDKRHRYSNRQSRYCLLFYPQNCCAHLNSRPNCSCKILCDSMCDHTWSCMHVCGAQHHVSHTAHNCYVHVLCAHQTLLG